MSLFGFFNNPVGDVQGGEYGAVEGIGYERFAAISQSALKRLEKAKQIFLRHISTVDIPIGINAEKGIPIEIVPPKVHLVGGCWKQFKAFVESHGCSCKRREATSLEMNKEQRKLKRASHFIAVSVPASAAAKARGMVQPGATSATGNRKAPRKSKAAPSAYIIFSGEKREEIRAANPHATFGDVGKLLGIMWQALGEQGKAAYIKKAEVAKAAMAKHETSIRSQGAALTKKVKGPSAYLIFSAEKRQEIMAANPHATFSEVGKVLGGMWQSLGDQGKQIYMKKAEEQRIAIESVSSGLASHSHSALAALHGVVTMESLKSKRKATPSAYILFSAEKRPEIMAANPNATFAEVGKVLGGMWHSLGEKGKLPYIKEASDRKAEVIAATTDPNSGFKKSKPRQAPSAYMLFSAEKRQLIMAANPHATFAEVGKHLGGMWPALGEKGKFPYVKKSNELRAVAIAQMQHQQQQQQQSSSSSMGGMVGVGVGMKRKDYSNIPILDDRSHMMMSMQQMGGMGPMGGMGGVMGGSMMGMGGGMMSQQQMMNQQQQMMGGGMGNQMMNMGVVDDDDDDENSPTKKMRK